MPTTTQTEPIAFSRAFMGEAEALAAAEPANVIKHAGATPAFADVDPRTYNIDPADVARKISARTKVAMPVDQIGLPCAIDALHVICTRHGLRLRLGRDIGAKWAARRASARRRDRRSAAIS